MNGWDIATWLSAVALAGSAVVIFAFFLRDARSIFNREMHGHPDEAKDSFDSGSAAGETQPSPPEDLSR